VDAKAPDLDVCSLTVPEYLSQPLWITTFSYKGKSIMRHKLGINESASAWVPFEKGKDPEGGRRAPRCPGWPSHARDVELPAQQAPYAVQHRSAAVEHVRVPLASGTVRPQRCYLLLLPPGEPALVPVLESLLHPVRAPDDFPASCAPAVALQDDIRAPGQEKGIFNGQFLAGRDVPHADQKNVAAHAQIRLAGMVDQHHDVFIFVRDESREIKVIGDLE
jgi:hypothetical protein